MMRKIILAVLLTAAFLPTAAMADVAADRRALAHYISDEINTRLKGE